MIKKFVACPCGSGRNSAWQYDKRNIPIRRTCPVCHDRVMGTYRPEVLNDPNYKADEPIEPKD